METAEPTAEATHSRGIEKTLSFGFIREKNTEQITVVVCAISLAWNPRTWKPWLDQYINNDPCVRDGLILLLLPTPYSYSPLLPASTGTSNAYRDRVRTKVPNKEGTRLELNGQ